MQRKKRRELEKEISKRNLQKEWTQEKNNLKQVQCFGSGFNQVSGPVSGFRIRIREGKMTDKNREKLKKFHVLKCWMFSLEG
jgi:hypothetical protein